MSSAQAQQTHDQAVREDAPEEGGLLCGGTWVWTTAGRVAIKGVGFGAEVQTWREGESGY